MKIVIAIVVSLLIILAGLVIASFCYYKNCREHGRHDTVVGQIQYWQKSKLPGYAVGCLSYRKSGKPLMAQTVMLPKRKQMKPGAMAQWDVATFSLAGRKITQAKPIKNK